MQIKDTVYASFTWSEAGLLFPYFAIESLTLPHANYFAEYVPRDREKCYTTPFWTVHSITLLWQLYNKSLTPILWKHIQLPYCIYLDIYFRLVHSLSCLCQELCCFFFKFVNGFLNLFVGGSSSISNWSPKFSSTVAVSVGLGRIRAWVKCSGQRSCLRFSDVISLPFLFFTGPLPFE